MVVDGGEVGFVRWVFFLSLSFLVFVEGVVLVIRVKLELKVLKKFGGKLERVWKLNKKKLNYKPGQLT